MKKYSYVGALVDLCDWILHPVANYKELHDYRNTIDIFQNDYENRKEEFKKKLQEEQRQNDELKEISLNRKNALVEIEKKINDYKAIIVDLENKGVEKSKEITDMKATIRALEQKIIYRDNVITTLRNTRKELKCQIEQNEIQLNEAREQVLELAKKVMFYDKKCKKTPREKIDYTLMKRSSK